jgi:hypothetical protein
MPVGQNRKEPLLIGVTGHRELGGIAELEQEVRAILAGYRIECPASPFHVLTSLAEGADRLVARIARYEFDAEMIAVLPMPVDVYGSDFETPQSRAEFAAMLGGALKSFVVGCEGSARDACYAAASLWIATHAEIVIALWDGVDSRLPGGTSWMLNERAKLLRRLTEENVPRDSPVFGPVRIVPVAR